MNKLELFKQVVSGVAGVGVGKIIRGVVANNVTIESKPALVAVYLGQVGIGLVAGDLVDKAINAQIDRAHKFGTEVKAAVEAQRGNA